MMTYREQVRALVEEVTSALQSVDPDALGSLKQAILDAPRVFVAGMGRSGLYMRAFAMRLMHLGLPVYVVGDVTTPGIAESELLLIGSGSGGTASLVQYAQHAKALNARVALISTALTSRIGDQSDCTIVISAPTPKRDDGDGLFSIQPMGSLFEQSLGLLLDILVLQLMADLSVDAGQMFSRHANLE
jgi:6-phospho-3-hexuloisomerase